eukprot:scaffold495567_cov20-Prasinocladus_malaysianus.AAC.1
MPLKQDAAPSCANKDALSYPLNDEVATKVGQGTEVTSCTKCEYGSKIGACYSITAPMGSYDGVLDGWNAAEATYEGITCEDLESLDGFYDDLANAVGTAMAI